MGEKNHCDAHSSCYQTTLNETDSNVESVDEAEITQELKSNVESVDEATAIAPGCTQASLDFCCGAHGVHVGNKCDCSKGISAAGQCADDIAVPILGKIRSYAYCCGIGTPCICGLNDNNNNTQMEV